ncbi:hypothetical protein BSKO_04947 [Bryopsis sp. KO-2023]|nr:hypothetical protein BSKO_04947 [Bryopsis sp. KO-2023]
MSAQELRQLKIKTGSVKRLRKEMDYYAKEVQEEHEKVEKLKSQGVDPPNLQQAEMVLAESKAMIPDTKQRLEAAIADLKKFLEESEKELSGAEELGTANEILADAEAAVA